MDTGEVAAVLDPLYEQITKTIEDLRLEGAEAFLEGDYDITDALKDKISKIRTFQRKVQSLQQEVEGLDQEWENLLAVTVHPIEEVAVASIPSYSAFMNHLIQALKKLGGSGTVGEINSKTAEVAGLSNEQRRVLHDPEKSERTEVECQLGWTRTYLKKCGVIENPSRGVWNLTPKGKQLDYVNPEIVIRFVREQAKKGKRSRRKTSHVSTTEKTRTKRTGRRGLLPPDGTKCQFEYKGNEYQGEIRNGNLVVSGYDAFSSFSTASKAITRTSRNGWNDWYLQLPQTTNWTLADSWRRSQNI